MRAKTSPKGIPKRFVATAAAVVLVGLLAGASSADGGAAEAAKAWEPPRVVRIEGAKMMCFNFSRTGMAWLTGAEKGRPAGLLARDGDILLVMIVKDVGAALAYRSSDGARLSFRHDEHCVYLADKAICPWAPNDKPEKLWEWLAKAAPGDLATLRFLPLPKKTPITPSRLAILKKVARSNPGLALGINELKAAAEVVQLFKPRWLLCDAQLFKEEPTKVLPSLSQVQFLQLNKPDKRSLAFLPKLPDLRTLLLADWEPQATGPLPGGFKRLRGLTLAGAKMADLSSVAHLSGLRELHVIASSPLTDLSALSRLSQLNTLSLTLCEKLSDISALKKLPGLKWLALPPQISQEQFAAVVRDHPGLQVLELVECKNVKDLSPLLGLRELRGLALLQTPADPGPLAQMKGLRFLALGGEVFKKSPDTVRKLEKALPDCLIVAGAKLCLGSGWVLLLLPALAVAWLLAARRRRRLRLAPEDA